MASIPPLLFPTLSFSMCALIIFKTSLAHFTNQNYNNSLITLAVQTFSFILVSTFLSAIVLLILHVARPQSAYTKHLVMATGALTFDILLLGVTLMVTFVLGTAAVVPDTIMAAVIVAATMIVYISFVRSTFNLCSYLTTGFVPVSFGLCISTAALFLLNQSPFFFCTGYTNKLSNQVIHLFLFGNFTLAIVLLFLLSNAIPDGTPCVISAGMVEWLAKMTVAMSLTVIAIGVYMMVAVLVETKLSFV